MLTQEKLKQTLSYNPVTGFFKWKNPACKRLVSGDLAGSVNSRGYSVIRVNYKRYLSHRLAWLYVYGYMPENEIDHIDRNPTNNKIKNLREVSRSCNLRNQGQRKNNTSGVTGVYLHESGKWYASIHIGRKQVRVGYHDDFLEAVCHRLAAEQCLDWHRCSLTSSAYKYVCGGNGFTVTQDGSTRESVIFGFNSRSPQPPKE